MAPSPPRALVCHGAVSFLLNVILSKEKNHLNFQLFTWLFPYHTKRVSKVAGRATEVVRLTICELKGQRTQTQSKLLKMGSRQESLPRTPKLRVWESQSGSLPFPQSPQQTTPGSKTASRSLGSVRPLNSPTTYPMLFQLELR